ncbi:hypothetical protein MKK75_10975 [Methylobacterium sp. J-030]|uniref:hypothetical protein n=1 Tax=Methylobacterium sp. J-030 TaxID=2836627 RepID=UPI001FB8CB82|nr:hypothetical protein [Methylobacterium sp. J-030]MCJ2069316.1 hypothetical protein [Methylobacterium sp. J-030]
MATHAYSTRTPLLPVTDAPQRLLREGPNRQFGPVTNAIAAMRAADPDAREAPIDGRQAALDALRIEDPEVERVPTLRALRLALLAAIEGELLTNTGRRA